MDARAAEADDDPSGVETGDAAGLAAELPATSQPTVAMSKIGNSKAPNWARRRMLSSPGTRRMVRWRLR